MDTTKVAAIVVAGGTGSRAASGDADLPKQYRMLAGRPLLARTVGRLLDNPGIDRVLVVIGAGHDALYAEAMPDHPKLLAPVTGGGTRQESVLAGLEALRAMAPQRVLIHDAARPFITDRLLADILSALDAVPGALPVTLVTDTIKRSHDGKTVGGTEDRTQLYAAQTPQGFRYDAILDAHRRAIVFSDGFTDDAAVAEWAGLPVALVEGETQNFKITLAADFARAERMLLGEQSMETRVGSGFDVHAFTAGDEVVLGGVRMPHEAALMGHSDADVVLHALADAIYGALAEGDIGRHFPPSDPQWKGAESAIFLAHAAGLLRQRGGRLVHCDVTILAEAPKIGPHADAIRTRIAGIAGIAASRVSIKATTMETLGFVGRREGIAALASATVEVPRQED